MTVKGLKTGIKFISGVGNSLTSKIFEAYYNRYKNILA